jgi:hypothetical protein
MLWAWIGDYRRHTFNDIYLDDIIPPRTKIEQIVQRHKALIAVIAPVIIARYKTQWGTLNTPVCTNIKSALKNLHLLFTINNSIRDLDPTKIYTTHEIVILLIPTLQHDNFCPLMDFWNHRIATNQEIPLATIQPSMEKLFIAKNSVNDLTSYTHVALQPEDIQTRRTLSTSRSTSPSKQQHAYAAAAQAPPLPTTQAHLDQMIATAIKAHDLARRSRSPSYPTQQATRDFPRDRSRDRDSYNQRNNERRSDNRFPRSRDQDRNLRNDRYQRCPEGSMPRSPREPSLRGDRSPSSDRRESSKAGPANHA